MVSLKGSNGFLLNFLKTHKKFIEFSRFCETFQNSAKPLIYYQRNK